MPWDLSIRDSSTAREPCGPPTHPLQHTSSLAERGNPSPAPAAAVNQSHLPTRSSGLSTPLLHPPFLANPYERRRIRGRKAHIDGDVRDPAYFSELTTGCQHSKNDNANEPYRTNATNLFFRRLWCVFRGLPLVSPEYELKGGLRPSAPVTRLRAAFKPDKPPLSFLDQDLCNPLGRLGPLCPPWKRRMLHS